MLAESLDRSMVYLWDFKLGSLPAGSEHPITAGYMLGSSTVRITNSTMSFGNALFFLICELLYY